MDRELTFEVVYNSPPDKWPSLEEFEEIEEIIKWRDLPKGMYKILETHIKDETDTDHLLC